MSELKVFTTGQAARALDVMPKTVERFCREEGLKHRRIPGSQDIRIERDDLITFAKKHGFSLNALEEELEPTEGKKLVMQAGAILSGTNLPRVLLVSADPELSEILRREWVGEFLFDKALEASNALHRMEQFVPDVIMVDFSIGEAEANELCAKLKEKNPDLTIVALVSPNASLTDEANDAIDGVMTESTSLTGLIRNYMAEKSQKEKHN